MLADVVAHGYYDCNAEVAKRVRETARRIEKASRAGRPADPNDALLVRDAKGCAEVVSLGDDLFELCREIRKRTPLMIFCS